jgi:hypothetical protein
MLLIGYYDLLNLMLALFQGLSQNEIHAFSMLAITLPIDFILPIDTESPLSKTSLIMLCEFAMLPRFHLRFFDELSADVLDFDPII